MVKSFGGNKTKKQARKHIIEHDAETHKTRYKDENIHEEIYCIVKKNLGGTNILVEDNNQQEYICIIRNKFRGRNKRDNIITPGNLILTAKRSWETTSNDKKPKCDLLEVYIDIDQQNIFKNHLSFTNNLQNHKDFENSNYFHNHDDSDNNQEKSQSNILYKKSNKNTDNSNTDNRNTDNSNTDSETDSDKFNIDDI